MKREEQFTRPKYIFPDFVAKAMSKVDMRTQLEASMLSMTLMSIGLILSVIYAIFYADFALWMKINLIVNGVFGLIFMSSYIITTYQSYLSYMEIQDFQNKKMKGGKER